MARPMLRRENPHPEQMQAFRISCADCYGYCCTALCFFKTDGFPMDKPAETPCRNLEPDFRCRVHDQLSSKGWKGCRAYDCLGAGQAAARLYRKDWREAPGTASEQFTVFLTLCRLRQIGWHLVEALQLLPAKPLWAALEAQLAENQRLAGQPAGALIGLDLSAHQAQVNPLLKQAAALTMQAAGGGKRCADGIGKRFRGELSGMDFSLALLIAANFSGCTFYGINLLGADLREADFSDSDLRGAFFLTQGQLNAAKGNRNTRIPEGLSHPSHWD